MNTAISRTDELRNNLEDAMRRLAPKFQISDAELSKFDNPVVVMGETKSDFAAGYDPVENKFIFTPKFVEDFHAIGEEASHYLHAQLNPSLIEAKSRFDRMNVNVLAETVGGYGYIVYMTTHGGVLKNVMLKRLGLYADGFLPGTSLPHVIGYSRALGLFDKFGESMLPKVARMSLEEAKSTLPKLAPVFIHDQILWSLGKVLR